MAVLVQGGTAIELGYYETARTLLDEALILAREAGDAFRIAYALKWFGDLACCEQNYAEAKITYENSAALLRELGATRDLTSPLQNLGHTCLHLGDVERAHALFSESLAVCRRGKFTRKIFGFDGFCLCTNPSLYCKSGV